MLPYCNLYSEYLLFLFLFLLLRFLFSFCTVFVATQHSKFSLRFCFDSAKLTQSNNNFCGLAACFQKYHCHCCHCGQFLCLLQIVVILACYCFCCCCYVLHAICRSNNGTLAATDILLEKGLANTRPHALMPTLTTHIHT